MVLFDHFCLTVGWSNSLPGLLVFQARSSTATNKFRYVVQSAGRASPSVRAVTCKRSTERRARSDATYHVSKFVCHSTKATLSRRRQRLWSRRGWSFEWLSWSCPVESAGWPGSSADHFGWHCCDCFACCLRTYRSGPAEVLADLPRGRG